MSNSIVACGQEIDVGCRIIKWNESGFSFYYSKKYAGRNITLEKLRQDVNIAVIQQSNTYTAKQAYIGLISRAASVNFIIDDDDNDGYATIYQCLDVKDAGFSHAPFNQNGPGIMLCYRSLSGATRQAYSLDNQQKHNVYSHSTNDEQIHGRKINGYIPTYAQVNSCISLLSGIIKLFPNILPYFPRDAYGNLVKTFIPNPESYRGLLCNYHLSRAKTDPLGLDLKTIENALAIKSIQ